MASTHGGRTAILVMTIAGGLFGGWLGGQLSDFDTASLVLLLLVGTGIGSAAALGLLTTDVAQRPDETAPQPGVPEQNWAPVGPAPGRPDAPNHIAALPLPAETEGRKWWNQGAPRVAANRSEVPAPPLSSYAAERALIAQCPRCGDFRLDVNGGAQTYAFRCHHCGNAWQWTPGTPWPAVVVRRNLTRK